MNKKKIALMVHNITGGGMEHVAAQMSRMFSENGYKVFIFVWEFNRWDCFSYSGKIIKLEPVTIKGRKTILSELLWYIRNAYIVRRAKRKYQIDVSISFAPEMNLINLLSRYKDKEILTVHCCMSERRDFCGIAYSKFIARWCNCAEKIITVSKWCEKDLTDNYGINRKKVKTIYNPIEKIEIQLDRKKENIVLAVGRMHDVKQQWHIIRAFKEVIKLVPDAKLVIAGKGENEKYLKKLSNELELNAHIVYMGYVKKMDELYENAKVLVFSSASEAFPCSALEAIAKGVPVVAADCPGGISEIITGKTRYKEHIEDKIYGVCGILTLPLEHAKYDAKTPLTKAEKILADSIVEMLVNENLYKNATAGCVAMSRKFYIDKIGREWKKQIENV